MNCHEIEAESLLWFSGELDAARKRAFDRHVARCAACARFLEEQSSLDSRILSAFGEPLEDAEAARIERRVMQRITAERRRRQLFALGLAALVMVALAVGYRNRSAEHAEQLFADAARDHRLEVVEHKARRWRTDLPDIEKLSANFGLSGEQAMGLAPPGFRFSRARTCGLEGRAALHLVFSDGAHEISVYVRRGSGGGDVRLASLDGEQVAAMRMAGYEAIAVSTGTAADCARVVRRAASRL